MPSMGQDVNHLKNKRTIRGTLELEKIDDNLFRSINLWKPNPAARAVYGGQIIGQSLVAAHYTVPDGFEAHSMHAYFVLPGDNTIPAVYQVSNLRDGRSFVTRTVVVKQRGRVIFTTQVSFHRHEDSAVKYQVAMPDAPDPETLPSSGEVLHEMMQEEETQKLLKKYPRVKEYLEKRINTPFVIDMRFCDPQNSQVSLPFPINKRRPAREPKQLVWIKARETLPDKLSAHSCVVAYASDYHLMPTAMLGVGYPANKFGWAMTASLDHSLWFHAPFRADDWMLYELYCVRAEAGRALVHGRMYTRDGVLAVSTTQEGVLRLATKPQNFLTSTKAKM